MLSGLFSGLTLGLMGLDLNGLDIVINGDDVQNSRFAQQIKPVRANGNLLLCTLLLGNVAVNAALSTVTADIFGGLAGFLGSTAAITVLGEIVPQAACSRYALYVGSKSIPIVKFFMLLLCPLAYPISWVLNKVLGDELGTIYSKAEFEKLIKIHLENSALDEEEENIMTGALQYKAKIVSAVMTPINKAFMIHIDAILNFRTISDLWKSGFSRVPVYGRDRNDIVGLLLVKDLIMIDPEDNTSVQQLVPFFGRRIHFVFDDQKLNEVLKVFKMGKGHMGMVQRVNNDGAGDPFYEQVGIVNSINNDCYSINNDYYSINNDCHSINNDPFYEQVGIVTLEDIIEEILQDEIVDETDVFVHMEQSDRVERQSFDFARLRLLDTDGGKDRRLDAGEAQAVVAHLCANVTEFSLARKHDGSRVENTDVKWLVMRSEVLNWEDDDDDRDLRRYQKSSPGRVAAPVVQGARKRANSVNKTLYKRGKGTEFCTLVLSGKLNIVVGRDGFKVRGESGGRREGERREGGRPGRDRGATGERGAGSRG
jgi:metal transporter CNNM